ncbi:MAG: uL14 family ribosomal protein [Nanoarchaeota archaeon]
MKGLKAKITRPLPFGARLDVVDNSGAKIIRLYTVYKIKTVKGKIVAGGVSDLINANVVKGKPEMKKKSVLAVIIRQKKEYRRRDGSRVQFEDNAAVVVKDNKGNPQGTLIKGPVAKEVCERWPAIAKIATIIV